MTSAVYRSPALDPPLRVSQQDSLTLSYTVIMLSLKLVTCTTALLKGDALLQELRGEQCAWLNARASCHHITGSLAYNQSNCSPDDCTHILKCYSQCSRIKLDELILQII